MRGHAMRRTLTCLPPYVTRQPPRDAIISSRPRSKTEWGINIAIAAASWPLSFLTRIATKMFFPAA